MTLHRVLATEVPPTRWRNGAGRVRNLLQWPAAGEAMCVHVALATIERDSPFSPYPGMQRWVQGLGDAGVWLRHDAASGLAAVRLHRDAPTYAFDGAHAPHAQPEAGEVDDLSFMVPAAQGRGWMARAAAEQPAPGPGDTWRGLFSLGPCTLLRGGTATALPALSLAWCAGASLPAWQVLPVPGQALHAWWLGFQPAR